MKKSYLLLLLASVLFSLNPAQAQIANCGASPATAGSLVPPASLDVEVGMMTPAAVLTGYSGGLPNIEYVAVNPNDLVISPDGILGPRILDVNDTGIFDPAALGLMPGDQISVQALSYDLSVVQNAVDELLFGNFIGIPCCDLFQTFFDGDLCDTLMAAGVSSSADVNSLTDVLGFASAFGDNNSVEATVYIIDTVINEVIYSGTPCTGGAPICYTATTLLTYNVVTSSLCANAPSGLAASVSPAAVILSWNSLAADGALGYKVCGRPVGSSGLGCGPIILEPNTTFALPTSLLTPGVTYEWNVTGGCATDGSILSPTSAFATFTAPSPRLAGQIEVEIRPNPVTTQMVVRSNEATTYRITNLSGVLLMEGNLLQGENNIDLPELTNGLYLMEVEGGSVHKFEVIK